MNPSPEILYESEFLRVVTNGFRSDVRFLTFNHLFYGKVGRRFWGDEFFAKYNLGAIGFVSPRPDWFPEDVMRPAIDAIRAALVRAPGERLISYGVSMGGYAALKYAAPLGVDTAIAFSPQISISPDDVARFDARYLRYYDPALNRQMMIRAEDLAPDNHVLYDNFWTVDRKHADQIAALGPVRRFVLPFTGHASVRAIAEGRIARPFLLRLADTNENKPADLRAMVRGSRRRTLVYWESRAVSLAGRRPAATQQILHAVRSALELAPETTPLQIALVLALLNCNEREEAEWELAKIHLGARAPVAQWIRYIDCYRRIHGDGATLEMMGRASPELQTHAAFRFEDAVIRLDMGDVASAAAILSLIWPEQEQITRRMKLGLVLGAVGEKEKATEVFRTLAKEAPSAENLIQLASALAEDRLDREAASEALTRLAEARKIIDPEPNLWRRVLLLYDRLDDRAEHIAAGRQAVAALPGYPDLRMELAIALERGGQTAEAVAMAARLIPDYARIRRVDWLILMLRKAGMTAEAFTVARAVASERPDDSSSRLQLAILLLDRGEEAEAFEHLQHVRVHPSGRPDLMEDAVRTFDAVGLHADAAKAAGRFAASHQDRLEPQLLVAERLIRAGFQQEARIHLRRIRKFVGNDPRSLAAIASLYRRAGEEMRAEELLARALGEGHPTDPPPSDEPASETPSDTPPRPSVTLSEEGSAGWEIKARLELLALRSRHGGRRGVGEARSAAAELAKQQNPHAWFWAGLADLFALLGQLPRALAAIGKAVALSPDDPAHRLRQAELLCAAGKRADATARILEITAAPLTNQGFGRALSLLEQAGDLETVRRVAEQRLAAFPRDAATRLALARALLRRGDQATGRVRLGELMGRRAGDALFWSGVGDLFLDLRDWPQAKEAAERAVANDPGNAKRAEQIIGMVKLMGNRTTPIATPPRGPSGFVMASRRRPGLLSLLAETFRRSSS